MKNRFYFFLPVITLFLFQEIHACDLCGCFMGITPYDNQSNIGILYKYRSYNGYSQLNQPHRLFPDGWLRVKSPLNQTDHAAQNGPPEHSSQDYEVVRSVELRGKYFLHNRTEINAVIPCNTISNNAAGNLERSAGIGDMHVFAGYHLLRKVAELNTQQRLIAGAGIKFPTGSFTKTDHDGERQPLLAQPGTGSTDPFFYMQYIIAIHQCGAAIYGMYKINGTNSFDERLDNSFSGQSSVFYKVSRGKWTIIPSLQAYYENTTGERIGGNLQNGTAMNLLLCGGGIDLFYGNLGLNTSLQFPLTEKQNGDDPATAGRIVLGLTYNFKQMNYLVKSRP